MSYQLSDQEYVKSLKHQKKQTTNFISAKLQKAILACLVPEMTIAEFANSLDLAEVAHYEPPHVDLHCLPFSL